MHNQPRIDDQDLANLPPARHHARMAPERHVEEAKDSEGSDATHDTEEVLVHVPDLGADSEADPVANLEQDQVAEPGQVRGLIEA